MAKVKKPYTVIGISLPNETWQDIDEQAEQWGTSGRSAAVLRIVSEWKALRRALAAKKDASDSTEIIIIAA
jgi:hypothetical protein